MTTYEFDVILKGLTELDDEQVDALFAVGCDDGTPASRNGIAWMHFQRQSTSLEEAIRSAIAQVQSARLVVAKVEFEVNDTVSSQI